MPPCAFDELFACSEPFVATATHAPARSAETAAARPEAPLPITSTSKGTGAVTPATVPPWPNPTHEERLSPDRVEKLLDLVRRCRLRVPLVPGAAGRHLGHAAQAVLRHAEVAEPLEPAEPRQLRGLRRWIVRRA